MIVFRVDASPRVGSGHITRSRRLAAVLKERGEPCVIIAPDGYRKPEDDELFGEWIGAGEWTAPETDARRLVSVAEAHGAGTIYVDDYRADESYQRILLDAGLRWMQQFDASLPRSYWCDVLVNASPSSWLLRFKDKMRKPGSRTLFGPRYAILRPEFPPALRPADRPLRQTLVTFGGGDDRGGVIAVLEALLPRTPETLRFVVVSGPKNPRNPENARWIEQHGRGRVTLAVDAPNIAELFASCDMSVNAGGTTTSEAAACGLPMVMFSIEDNQINQCQGWADEGCGVFLGAFAEFDSATFVEAFLALADDDANRTAMSERGRALVDGKGVHRLADDLINGLAA